MNAEEFAGAIARNDISALIRLPGIGRKTAERLVIEMRDRLADGFFEGVAAGGSVGQTGSVSPLAGADQEAMSALEALGYKPAEAQRMVKAVPDAEGLPVEQIIRLALKPLASKV